MHILKLFSVCLILIKVLNASLGILLKICYPVSFHIDVWYHLFLKKNIV